VPGLEPRCEGHSWIFSGTDRGGFPLLWQKPKFVEIEERRGQILSRSYSPSPSLFM